MKMRNRTTCTPDFPRRLAGSLLVVLALVAVMAGCNSGGRGGADGAWSGLPTVSGIEEVVSGKITNASAQPVSGATVAFFQNETLVKSTTTGTDGTYQVLLVPGTYAMRVAQPGYASIEQALVVSIGGTSGANLVISSSVGTLSGAIRDTRAGSGIASVSVTVVSQTTPALQISPVMTDAAGIYQFALATGTYRVTASKNGYANGSATVTIVSNTSVIQDFALSPNGAYLSGLVTDTEGTPQNDVLIRVVPVGGVGSALDVKTGEDGKYNLYISSGTFTMTLTKMGFGRQTATVVIRANQDQIKDFSLGPKSTMNGVVKLTTTSETLPNILVEVYLNGSFVGSGNTTSKGEFVFENLSPGTYNIGLARDAPAYSPATYVVLILNDGSLVPEQPELFVSPRVLTGEDVVHPLAAGTVHDAFTKAPLQYVTCTLKGVGGTISDDQGRFSFTNLVPGDFELTFSKPGWQDLTINFIVKENNGVTTMFPATLAFQMIQNQEVDVGAITGRFVDETTGIGVNGLIVRVYPMKYETRTITVIVSGQESEKDVSYWEVGGAPVLSTRTGEDSVGNEDLAGTFRLEHLQETSDTGKYLVYVGTGNSTLLRSVFNDPADVGNPLQIWMIENAAGNASRLHSWSLVDVVAKTTTYLENYNPPNY